MGREEAGAAGFLRKRVRCCKPLCIARTYPAMMCATRAGLVLHWCGRKWSFRRVRGHRCGWLFRLRWPRDAFPRSSNAEPRNHGWRSVLITLREGPNENNCFLGDGLLSSDERPKRPRLALRRGDHAGVAAELLTILQTITADGRITDDEANHLSDWLADNAAAASFPGFHYLNGILSHALADGTLTDDERKEIYKAIEKVLPADARREAKERRGAVEAIEGLHARAEKEAQRQHRIANTVAKSANFLVAGVGYEGRERVVEKYAHVGDTVYLVRDPDNRYDHNAIEIRLANNQQVGYVPAPIAAELVSLMDAGFLQRAFVTKLYEGKRHNIPVVQAYWYGPDATVHDALSPGAVRSILDLGYTDGGEPLRPEAARVTAASSRSGCGCLTAALLIAVSTLLIIWLT